MWEEFNLFIHSTCLAFVHIYVSRDSHISIHTYKVYTSVNTAHRRAHVGLYYTHSNSHPLIILSRIPVFFRSKKPRHLSNVSSPSSIYNAITPKIPEINHIMTCNSGLAFQMTTAGHRWHQLATLALGKCYFY